MPARHRGPPVAALIALAAMLLPAAARAGDPDLVFETIHTEHFNIHFHQGLERTARIVATVAEEIHDRLTIQLGWEVDGPTEVVITDSTDSANGMAMASPRPMVWLYATGPDTDSALTNHDHWLRTLFMHEYTHVIHLQMHGGLARVINAIFGDVYLPNQMQPRWFIEGLAQMNETHQTTAGRNRSASYAMSLRAAATIRATRDRSLPRRPRTSNVAAISTTPRTARTAGSAECTGDGRPSSSSTASATCTTCPATRSHATARSPRPTSPWPRPCCTPRCTSPSTPPGNVELRNCAR